MPKKRRGKKDYFTQLFLDDGSFIHLLSEEDVFFLREGNLGIPPAGSLLLPFREALFISYNIFLRVLSLLWAFVSLQIYSGCGSDGLNFHESIS